MFVKQLLHFPIFESSMLHGLTIPAPGGMTKYQHRLLLLFLKAIPAAERKKYPLPDYS